MTAFHRHASGTTTNTYSPVLTMRGEELIAVSGLLPVDADGALAGTTLAEQTAVVFDALSAQLVDLGLSLRNVLRIAGYLTELDEYGEYARLRGKYFGSELPASTVVQVAGLIVPGAKVEIDALAVR